MRLRTQVGMLAAAGVLVLTGCGGTAGDDAGQPATTAPGGDALAASMRTAEEAGVGTVRFTEAEGGIRVEAQIDGLEPGFYGLHVHGTGLCEPDSAAPGDPAATGSFLSAGGHLGSERGEHPDHAGDLPSLYVTDSGQGALTVLTDRFTLDELRDEDGSAVVIHSGADNYANIPDRYAPDGPDEDTLGTGDAGSRLACGVVE
ncbi:superoxide dismutase family protein [Kocuria flava]|uniref:superoxide dismutase family protein n=1 Tax=Kocuria flava TaxID=446860 RepID=UPI001FF37FB6|nr:superoxide dismutase family protein [Kocuria flava]MCJ8505516.1 superoxide dismutase family protein [Kocuria flava]